MDCYYIKAIVNGKSKDINKLFGTEDDAINYMLKYYDRHYIFSFQVEEENELSPNSIEYVYTNTNKFTVNKIQIV